MDFEVFLENERPRVEAYISRFGRAYGLRGDSIRDLRQEAYLAAFKALRYWKPAPDAADIKRGKSAPYGYKSAFNWCAGPMRRAMEKAVRREFGERPCSKGRIVDRRTPYDDSRPGRWNSPDLDSITDLRRALNSDPKPQQIVRLIMMALSPASSGDIAQIEKVSRQAISYSACQAKVRLRAALA